MNYKEQKIENLRIVRDWVDADINISDVNPVIADTLSIELNRVDDEWLARSWKWAHMRMFTEEVLTKQVVELRMQDDAALVKMLTALTEIRAASKSDQGASSVWRIADKAIRGFEKRNDVQKSGEES